LIRFVAVAGYRDQPQVVAISSSLAEMSRQLVAVHDGQPDVEQRHVRIERCRVECVSSMAHERRPRWLGLF
jgi:hypothetical protein